jgi:ribonuclease HI
MKQFDVKIYIKTSLQGPCIKKGNYAAIVECITGKGPVTREISGKEDNTTYYRSVLIAIVKALNLLNASCYVTIYTDCIFIKNIVEQGRPEMWKRSEWKKASGKDIKNKELWQQYQDQASQHNISVRFSKYNNYVEKLMELLEKK